MKEPASGLKLPIRRGGVEYTLAGEADQESVYQTLLHVFHGPDRETFLGALSDPAYHPEQRLLAKIDGRVASHAHLTERQIRYGSTTLRMNGILWIATLPEYRGLGFAHNLLQLADRRSVETGAAVQALTTSSPQYYRSLGWGVCGRQTVGVSLSRNLPAPVEAPPDAKGVTWTVRPWRQVELNDLMGLYDSQFGRTTGTVVRSEDYWRWMIGRKYHHVIWVACQGETVRGYAFVKDHRILEIATSEAHPLALRHLLGRVRAEALERPYPQVIVHAPADHPVMTALKDSYGKVLDQDEYEGSYSMYHVPDPHAFLSALLPELAQRARQASVSVPTELGLAVADRKFLLQFSAKEQRLDMDRLGRRYLTLNPGALVRLAFGHTGIDRAISEDGVEPSTQTAIDSARILFPTMAVWRSPLDSATA